MLLECEHSQLLVIDIQEKLLPALHDADAMIERSAILMQAAHRLAIPVTVTEQYRKGLGPTDPRIETFRGNAPVFEKMHFSCSDDAATVAHLKSLSRKQIVICGAEAHVCVAQSALGFQKQGWDVAVVADAVTSRKTESRDLALSRLRHAGISVVNTEMAVFEWLNISGTPEFKEISKLVK
jgi:nicotinamidase-related amidase